MNAKYLVTAAVGLGMTVVGCLGGPSDDEIRAMELDPAAYETLDNPTGSGTSNHLPPWKFHEYKYDLLDAMSYPLRSSPASHTLSTNVINTGITSNADAKEVFTMAVECALADGDYVTRTVGLPPNAITYTFTGKGLMSTTAGWATAALTETQKEDVLRCVVARMNAFNQTVDIALMGLNVTNKPSETKPADMIEDALWDVDIVNYVLFGQPFTAINVYAWTLPVTLSSNGASCAQEAGDITKRVCDDDSTNCNVTAYESADDDCYAYGRMGGIVSYYKCKHGNPSQGRPVVTTWVTKGIVDELYASCYEFEGLPISVTPGLIPEAP